MGDVAIFLYIIWFSWRCAFWCHCRSGLARFDSLCSSLISLLVLCIADLSIASDKEKPLCSSIIQLSAQNVSPSFKGLEPECHASSVKLFDVFDLERQIKSHFL